MNLNSKSAYKTVYIAAARFAEREKLSILKQPEHNESDGSDENENNPENNEENSDTEFTLFDPDFRMHSDDISYVIDIKNIGLFNYSDEEMKQQSEWSETLNEIIWHFARLPCAWRFDKHRNVANEKIVFGSCRSTECNAKLFVYTENNLSKLKIVIKNFNLDAVHIEKRALKYSNKEKVAAMLKINHASQVHADLANELLEPFDYCPSHLPNQATLRKLKQREKDEELRDPDPIHALCIMKTEAMFHRSITDIGIDPFYCFFSTPEQREWLRLSTRFKNV